MAPRRDRARIAAVQRNGGKMIEWFRRNFTQDDFADDWYGYLTNQVGHIALGLMMALAVSLIWFVISGEMPVKRFAALACLAAYLALELVRGWNGLDSVEDTVFTAGYGSGGAFLIFSEITPGEPFLGFNIFLAGGIAVIAALHLIWGVSRRW